MKNQSLSEDFKEFILLMNKFGAEYLIVGGYAVGVYGHQRATKDIDIWINNNQINCEKMVNVAIEYGVDKEDVNLDMFRTDSKNVFIGDPPFRIDIINKLARITFEESYEKRKIVELDGVKINVINLYDLIITKRAAARPIDLDDIKNIDPGNR